MTNLATSESPGPEGYPIGFWIYLALGVPVAWWHLRQKEARETAGDRGFLFAIGMLAMMWPLLLFAMGANWLVGRMERKDREARVARETAKARDATK